VRSHQRAQGGGPDGSAGSADPQGTSPHVHGRLSNNARRSVTRPFKHQLRERNQGKVSLVSRQAPTSTRPFQHIALARLIRWELHASLQLHTMCPTPPRGESPCSPPLQKISLLKGWPGYLPPDISTSVHWVYTAGASPSPWYHSSGGTEQLEGRGLLPWTAA
jgi:hypothetical protein